MNKSYPPVPSADKISDGPFQLRIDKTKYSDGKCHLKAKLICLNHPDYLKGQELDEVAYVFWIAQDPPLGRGPFRDIERSSDVTEELEGRVVKVDAKVMPHPEGGYKLRMNIDHPLYKKKCKNKDDEPEYLMELMARKLPHILISENIEPFNGVEDPSEIMRRSWILYSQIMEKYHT